MNNIIGCKAPNFNLKAVSGDGKSLANIELGDYKGKWLVLFFYPLDFTFVCPTEITSFSDRQKEFEACGAELLGISTDSEYSHQAWIQNGLGQINYPLASDKTMSVSREYGVLIEDEGIALRGLFIIDSQQKVRYSVLHELNVGRSVGETLRVLKALQQGGLCGANWHEGETTLDAKIEEFSAKINEGVTVYSLPDCRYCQNVKTFLREHNVSYSVVDLSTDKEGQAFMKNRGYRALPVTVINGHEISGYRLEEIKQALS